MGGEALPERSRDRHSPDAFLRLRLNLTLHVIPASLDADDTGRDVEVAAAERAEFAAPESAVERGSPERLIVLRDGGEQLLRLGGCGDPIALPFDGRELQSERRVRVRG